MITINGMTIKEDNDYFEEGRDLLKFYKVNPNKFTRKEIIELGKRNYLIEKYLPEDWHDIWEISKKTGKVVKIRYKKKPSKFKPIDGFDDDNIETTKKIIHKMYNDTTPYQYNPIAAIEQFLIDLNLDEPEEKSDEDQ